MTSKLDFDDLDGNDVNSGMQIEEKAACNLIDSQSPAPAKSAIGGWKERKKQKTSKEQGSFVKTTLDPQHREMPPADPDFFRRGEEPIC